jgi:hypothetical protein
MAAPIKPAKKTVLGKTTYWLVPSLTTSGPLATEINATAGLNVTCFLLGDQDRPSGDTGKVELPRAFCETSTTEALDVTKVTVPNFRFMWDPQAAADDDDKKAWALLKDGYDGFLVERENVVSVTDAAVTAAQFVNWYQVSSGIAVPSQTGNDAAGLYTFDAAFACQAFGFNVAVA